ncbi:MAG: hypothetical protein ABW065_10890 [Solirubrobacterales bacterium]
MRADYDSRADALSIDFQVFEHFDAEEQVDDDFCNVGFVAGRPAALELIGPAQHLDLLEVAAERYGLDRAALIAAAQATLAAPDRLVTIEVGKSLLAKAA